MKLIMMLILPISFACASTPEQSKPGDKDCEKVIPTGSHMARVECKTPEQRKKENDAAKESLLKMQRDSTQLGS